MPTPLRPAPLPASLEENSAFGVVLDRILDDAKHLIVSEHTRLLDLRSSGGQAQMPAEKSAVNDATTQISFDLVNLARLSNKNTSLWNASVDDASAERINPERVLNVSYGDRCKLNEQEGVVVEGLSFNDQTKEKKWSGVDECVVSPSSRKDNKVTPPNLQEVRDKTLMPKLKGGVIDLRYDATQQRWKSRLFMDASISVRAKNHLHALVRQQSMGTLAKVQFCFTRLLESAGLYPVVAIDTVMSMLIMANAFVIGISADTPEWLGWVVIDVLFCLCFSVEFGLKLKYLGIQAYLCNDTLWNLFEVSLLALSICEVIIELIDLKAMPNGSALFRIFRLLRLAKLLRVCRLQCVSDLVMMVNGAIGGLRTLFWSIVMIAMPLYLVALILRETLGAETGETAEAFSTLSRSFFNLFRCIVAGDCSDSTGRPIFVSAAMEYGWVYALIYGFTLVFMVFGLFNVIVAIYVENTVAEAHSNEMKLKQKRLRDIDLFQQKSAELALCIFSFKQGTDFVAGESDWNAIHAMELTAEEFNEICGDHCFTEILSELDISREDQKNLFETLDVDCGGTLDVNELITGIARLRGEPSKSDIVGILLSIHHVTRVLDYMVHQLQEHGEVLCFLQDSIRGESNIMSARK